MSLDITNVASNVTLPSIQRNNNFDAMVSANDLTSMHSSMRKRSGGPKNILGTKKSLEIELDLAAAASAGLIPMTSKNARNIRENMTQVRSEATHESALQQHLSGLGRDFDRHDLMKLNRILFPKDHKRNKIPLTQGISP